MLYVGLGRWMKRDVNFEDILTVCDLIREADGTPFLNRVRYYKRVVSILTTGTGFLGGRVRWYHCKLIFRVLKAADMLSDQAVDYDPAQRVLEFVNWLGPRLRMSPKEILQNYNMETLEGFYNEAIAFNLKRDLSKALAQHTPTEFHKLITEIYEFKRENALTVPRKSQDIAPPDDKGPPTVEPQQDRDPIRMLSHAFDIGG